MIATIDTAPDAACPLCRADTERLFAVHGHWVRACPMCGHRHAEIHDTDGHLRRVYGDSYFNGGGAGYADYLDEARLLRAHGRRYARQLARFTKPGRVLDIGAAAGFVLEGFIDAGWEGAAIEPNTAMADLAAERLGIPVHRGTLDDYAGGGEPFDLVLLVQVVAHFVDVGEQLAAAARQVRPGGYVLVETWNRNSIVARLLGRHWHEYNPPSVVHWFSADALDRLLGRFGFMRVARGHPLKLLDGAHVRSLLEHQLRSSKLGARLCPALSLIPPRLAVPYLFGDAFWALYRNGNGG